MLVIIIKTVVLSVIFIFIVHQIIYFLTDTLTVPKTKDLVSIIEKKYDEIHKTLQETPRISPDTTISQTTTSLSDLPICPNITTASGLDPPTISSIDTPDIDAMRSELQLFINQTNG